MRCVLIPALIMTLGAFPKWARPVWLATGLFNAESSEVRRARREKRELKYGLRPAAAHPTFSARSAPLCGLCVELASHPRAPTSRGYTSAVDA